MSCSMCAEFCRCGVECGCDCEPEIDVGAVSRSPPEPSMLSYVGGASPGLTPAGCDMFVRIVEKQQSRDTVLAVR